MPLIKKSEELRKEQNEKALQLINRFISEIVSDLMNNNAQISGREIAIACKKKEREVIKNLIAAGLPQNDVQVHVSQMRNKAAVELKKREKEEGKEKRKREERTEEIREVLVREEKAVEKGGKEEITPELRFQKQLRIKLEHAMYEICGEKIDLSPELKINLPLKTPMVITTMHQGSKREVILKEIHLKRFCDPTVVEVGKFIGLLEYKIKILDVEDQKNEIKNYAVIEKIQGRAVSTLKLHPFKTPVFEIQYFRELGKVMALSFICAIPDRTTDNIMYVRNINDIKIATYEFENAFSYLKHLSIACAQNTFNVNVSFFGRTIAKHKNDLREGFVGAFKLAENNKEEILGNIREFAKNTNNPIILNQVKKAITINPDEVFNQITSKSKEFKEDFEWVYEMLKNAISAVEGTGSDGVYKRKYRPLDSRGKPGGLVRIPKCGKLYLLNDLQGDVNLFLKFFEDNPKLISELANNTAYLVMAGDMIHAQTEAGESVTELDLLEAVMLLKTRFPNNVYYMLGNHCLGEILGDGILPIYKKGKTTEQKYFEKLIMEKYGDNYKKIHEGYIDFLKHLALIAITENGIIISHTGPIHGWNIKDTSESLEKFRNIFVNGYGKDNKDLYQMLWNRFGESFILDGIGYDSEDIEKFITAMKAKFMIVGHTPCRGYCFHGKQMVVDPYGNEGGYLIIDLTDESITTEKLKAGFRKFKEDKPEKKIWELHQEIMKK